MCLGYVCSWGMCVHVVKCVCVLFSMEVFHRFLKGERDSAPLVQTLESHPESPVEEAQDQVCQRESHQQDRLRRGQAGGRTGHEVLEDNVNNNHHLLFTPW